MGAGFRGVAGSWPGANIPASLAAGADVAVPAGTPTEITAFRSPLLIRDSGVYVLVGVGNLQFAENTPTALSFTMQLGTSVGGTQLGTFTQSLNSFLFGSFNVTMPFVGSIQFNAIQGQTVNASFVASSTGAAETFKQFSTMQWMVIRLQD